MSKFTQIRLALSKLIASFSEVHTDKGVLTNPEDGELVEGTELYTEKDGEFIPAEDGEYSLEDGTTFTLVSGRIESITKPVKEEEKFSEVPAEPAPVVETAPVVEPEPEPEPTPEPTPEHVKEEPVANPAMDAVKELTSAVEALSGKLSEYEKQLAAQQELLTKMSQMSAARPAQEEIEHTASPKTGNKQLDAKLKGLQR